MNAEFRFRNLDSIGAAGAEEDEFLADCFVDTGHLACLEDMGDRRVILLGRTGAGKTALLKTLHEKRTNETLAIAPEELALTYVSNSNVLNFFAGLGVNLDPFFKLLWRHVIVVEILARHVSSLPVERPKSLVDWLKSVFSSASREDREMREAIEYLNEWGRDFWLETEYRVKEITGKLESDLRTAVEGRAGITSLDSIIALGVAGRTESGQRVTEEQKAELLQRGQEVVSKAQVRDLQAVTKLLSKVLTKSGRQYYVLIDRLDENWVEDQIRYRLIMALLDAAKEFVRVKQAKVIVALRRDLLDRVFRLVRESGFQEEKYDSLCVPITWQKRQLLEVLDKRVDRLVRRRYTRKTVTYRDLLPRQVRKTPISDFIAQRTERPRDVIAFFNCCIQTATNLARLSVDELKTAEGEYSRSRLRALGDEWSADHPELLEFARLLARRRTGFRVADLDLPSVEEACLRVVISGATTGVLGQAAKAVVDCVLNVDEFRILLVKVLYATGLVALKLEAFEEPSWADERGRGVSAPEISDSTRVYVHPMYYRVLGIREEAR